MFPSMQKNVSVPHVACSHTVCIYRGCYVKGIEKSLQVEQEGVRNKKISNFNAVWFSNLSAIKDLV